MEIDMIEVEAKEGASGALYTVIKWKKCEVCHGRGVLSTSEGDVGCYGGCEQSGYIIAGQVEWGDALADIKAGVKARKAREAARLSRHYE